MFAVAEACLAGKQDIKEIKEMGDNNGLSNIKVLDFTGELGPYAAKLFVGLALMLFIWNPLPEIRLEILALFIKVWPERREVFSIFIIMPVKGEWP